MSELNIYRCSPRQIRSHITTCLKAGLAPFIQSSPGMGKSSIIKDIADELNLKVIDHRLSTSTPEDLTGLPRFDADGKAYFAAFADLFPLEDAEIPEGKDGWLIFLDEANSASKAVQAASYKLVLDREVGQHKLHPNVVIVLAGNLSTDKAIVTSLSTAMQSRLVHLEMKLDFKEWLEDVALKQNYDSRIIAYLNYKEKALMDFDANHKEKTFCCPRTWEFTNNILKVTDGHSSKPLPDTLAALLAGTITSGVAVDFIQFTKVYSSLVTVDDIRRDPDNLAVPSDTAVRWATISHMMEKVTPENFDDLATYANRFDLTFRILFFRAVIQGNPELRSHSAFRSAMTDLSKYLHG